MRIINFHSFISHKKFEMQNESIWIDYDEFRFDRSKLFSESSVESGWQFETFMHFKYISIIHAQWNVC